MTPPSTPAALEVAKLIHAEIESALSASGGVNAFPDPSAIAAIIDRAMAPHYLDTARLNFLDRISRGLNEQFSTLYGWRLISNHNVNRLLFGESRQNGIDLFDANPVGCHPTGMLSIRQAIDSHRPAARDGDMDRLVNQRLHEWSRAWRLDGDLVRCRECGRGIIYSRRDEALVHSSECKQVMAYPWELLISLAPPSPAEVAPERSATSLP